MAYSQQGRYVASRRPPYQPPEPSHTSAQSREHAQLAGTHAYGYENGYVEGYGSDSGQHYPNRYGPTQDSGYDQQNWSDAPAQYQRNDGYYVDRGQHHHPTGRLDQHRRPETTDRVGFGSNSPQSHGASPYESRAPVDGKYGLQPRHDPACEPRQSPDPRQLQDRYQNVVPPRANGGFGYDQAFDHPREHWQAQQDTHHGYRPELSGPHPDPGYQGRQQAPAEYDKAHSQGRVHDPRQAAAHPKYNQPSSSKPSPLKTSARDEEPKQTRQPPKRILDDMRSPDTVAWDNPFPTFPAAKAKSKVNNEVNGRGQNENGQSGPYTAPSKGAYGSAHHNGPKENGSGQDGYQPPLEAHYGRNSGDQAQERPSTSHTSPTALLGDNSNTTGVHGRQAHEKRTVANQVPRDSGYERSHTMPIAVTDAIVNPHDEMPEVAWQEPGATAGYYGGEDKGFVSSFPSGIAHPEPMEPSWGNTDESRQHQPKPQFPSHSAQQLAPSSEPHLLDDSIGEVFDSYYDAMSPQIKPYTPKNPSQRRRASLDELPNFDAAQNASTSHDRVTTIDQHLQPQPPSATQSFPKRDFYADQRQYSTTSYGADPLPRSKSQPDFNGGQRLPPKRSQQGQGFDFGVPESGDTRPATSSNGRSGPRSQFPLAPPSDRQFKDLHTGGQHSFGTVSESEQWVRGKPRVDGYQHDRQPPDGHRPPLAQNGYGDPRQQDAYRSPPQANGRHQGPRQPDRFRPPPEQLEPHRQPGQQDRYRSPPVHNGRPSDDRMRRPGGGSGGPTPGGWNGQTSSLGKASPNPDALPHHPAPVRPGLMGGPPANSANKPPPVRQYNTNSSPIGLAAPTEAPGFGRSQEGKRESNAVTYQELDRLRHKTQASPEDQATRFILAKKLVEASTVLVNERTDQKSREKAREDYIAQALKMLKKLSGNQYPDAMFYLGDCYSRGALGLQTDVKEAFTLYQSAAKANHAQAAYRVAVCCEMGQDEGGGTRKDPIKAMQWYKRAAQLGDVPAMYKMGVIQLKGLLGQPRNPREAIVFLKKAAERADAENPHALHELGLLHEKGSEGIPKDESYSKDLFIQCANLGYKFSQFRLGCAYEYGLMGCPVDPKQSIAWYSKAAVQEEHQSELALSGWYLTGSEGVLQQSDTEAYLWARKAAHAGMAKAEYAMGYFTEVGIGAPANLEDAKRWYWRAACEFLPLISPSEQS